MADDRTHRGPDAIGSASPRRSAQPLLAAALITLAGLACIALRMAVIPSGDIISIALPCLLAVAVVVLLLRAPAARLIAAVAAGVGIACYLYSVVDMWELVVMGAISPVFLLFPLAAAGLLALALVVALLWHPASRS